MAVDLHPVGIPLHVAPLQESWWQLRAAQCLSCNTGAWYTCLIWISCSIAHREAASPSPPPFTCGLIVLRFYIIASHPCVTCATLP